MIASATYWLACNPGKAGAVLIAVTLAGVTGRVALDWLDRRLAEATDLGTVDE